MKFDLHCHTKAGSIDAKVPLWRYIQLLKAQGFDGMLVTDHDSYRGFRRWKASADAAACGDFVVLEGIEYDTKDAGHFLVIMPDGIHLPVLRLRGMSLATLINVVHQWGGILGPAHPFGTRSSSAMFFKAIRQNPAICHQFDFIEGFNTCETSHANRAAKDLADRYGKPCTGGSDAHVEAYIGMAYTQLQGQIRSNNDLISAIRQRRITACGGAVRPFTNKARHKNAFYAVWGFQAYNRSLGVLYSPLRKHHIKKLCVNP